MKVLRDKKGRFIKGTGSYSKGIKLSDKRKKAISKFNKGKKYCLGRKHSDETKKKISKAHKGRFVGSKSPNWKGGKYKRYGYIYIYAPQHPNNIGKYVAEHRLVMENKINRYLKPREHVHHIDGNRSNNNIDNLILCTASEHNYLHNCHH